MNSVTMKLYVNGVRILPKQNILVALDNLRSVEIKFDAPAQIMTNSPTNPMNTTWRELNYNNRFKKINYSKLMN